MNAATVSGPRSRTKAAITNPQSSILLHRDERLSVATPDENLRDAARRHFLKFSRCVRRVRHWPPIDREDHVPLAQRTGCGTVRIDLCDDRAGLTRWQPEPPSHLRRHVVERDAEAAGILLVRLRLWLIGLLRTPPAVLLGLEIELVHRDVQSLLLLVAQHLDWHRRAWLGGDHHLDQLVAVVHGASVVLHDDVAGLDAGF